MGNSVLRRSKHEDSSDPPLSTIQTADVPVIDETQLEKEYYSIIDVWMGRLGALIYLPENIQIVEQYIGDSEHNIDGPVLLLSYNSLYISHPSKGLFFLDQARDSTINLIDIAEYMKKSFTQPLHHPDKACHYAAFKHRTSKILSNSFLSIILYRDCQSKLSLSVWWDRNRYSSIPMSALEEQLKG